MQIIFENEEKRSNSKGTNSIDTIICTGRISRCVEREYVRRFGGRGLFGRIKKRV